MRCALLLLLVSCVTTPPPPPAPAPKPPPPVVPKENAVRTRAAPFDVRACVKAKPPAPFNAATLAAHLEVERARFESCLSTSESRTSPDAGATLDITTGPKPLTKVTADGLTDAGIACLESRVNDLALPTTPPPFTASLTIGVPFGAADLSASPLPEVVALRAAVTASCTCFESLGTNAPPQLVLRHAPNQPIDVVTASDPLADKMERCLEPALADLPSSELELTVDLPLLNASALHESPDAQPDIAEAQRATLVRHATAELALVRAQRAAIIKLLDVLATPLKRKPTPALTQRRRAQCESLVELDDALPNLRERAADTSQDADAPHPLCAGFRTVE